MAVSRMQSVRVQHTTWQTVALFSESDKIDRTSSRASSEGTND